jgi:N,N'-diacetylchitobiose phosphorylase
MRFGRFDDEQKEYVIERPDTPRSWTNYLGNTTYGAIITNQAGGYSFFRSSAQGRFTRSLFHSVPMDQPGRYFYLRDQDDGATWTTSWQPMGRPLTQYQCECRHGTAYTRMTARYTDIRSEVTYFVPLGANYEVWWLRLKNESNRRRTLRLFTYLEYASEWHIQHDTMNQQYSQYIVRTEVVGNSIAQSSLGHLPEDPAHFENRDQSRHTFFSLLGAQIVGFDTSREAFIGGYRSYANPVVVETGEPTGSLAHGDNACASLCAEVPLEPGESRDILVLVGVGKVEREGAVARAAISDAGAAERALSELKAYWHGRLGRVRVDSPDPAFNSMVNVWNAYNSLITYAWSRSASLVYAGERDGLGYRDTVQDILGVLPAIAEEARPRLELMITGQVSTGGAMPVVKPFNHHPGQEQEPEHYRSDDCLWLFNTVPAYVKESGNIAFYDKVLPYADRGQASVLGHLRRAIEFNLERTGAHGLPCGLEADWNDCLKLGRGGESLFVAFQLRYALREYIEITSYLRRDSERAWALGELERLDQTLQTHAWDGQWFLRAYRDDGSTIGSHLDEEGSIYLNAQSWAVLSGAARPEQAEACLRAAHERLATPFGLVLCTPPYVKASHAVIRSVLYNTGQKENAGIFCHPQAWAVMAEIAVGHRDRAYEYYRAYMPSAYNEQAEVRQIEPYVHCQSTHGPDSQNYGKSRLPWLSGTASWSYYCAVHSILGLQPEYEGLRLAPSLPSTWPRVTVERLFRGKRFIIAIENSGEGRLRRMRVNGKEYADGFIPAVDFAEVNHVELELG